MKSKFLYDGMGRRVQRTDYSSWKGRAYRTANVTKYVWDGWLLLAELTADNVISNFYVHGLDLSQTLHGAGGIGGLLAARGPPADLHLFCYDGQGNVVNVLDGSGAVVASYRYSPFGCLVSESGPYADQNLFRFSTKMFELWWGFYYWNNRIYLPTIGRFLSRDPLEERVGANSYCFVRNAPITAFDVLGLITHRILPPSTIYVVTPYSWGGDYNANASLVCVCTPLGSSGPRKIECTLVATPVIRLNSNESIRRAVRALSRHPEITTEEHEQNHHRVFMNTYVSSFDALVAQYEGPECCNCQDRLLELLRLFNNLKSDLSAWENRMECGYFTPDWVWHEGGLEPWIEYGRGERPVPIPPVETDCR